MKLRPNNAPRPSSRSVNSKSNPATLPETAAESNVTGPLKSRPANGKRPVGLQVSTRKLGEVCRLVNGRAFKPSDWTSDGLRIIRIQNLNNPAAPFNHYRGAVAPKLLIHDGDVLLSWSGTPGTSFGCFLWQRGEAVLNQHIFVVHVNPDEYEKEFFVFAVNSELTEMIAQAHGAVGLQHITKGKLEQMDIPHFPLQEQRRIVERISDGLVRLDEMKHERISATEEAKALRNAALDSKFSEIAGPKVSLRDVVSIESRLVDPRTSEFSSMLHIGGANIESGTGTLVDLQTAADEGLISGKFVFSPEDVIYSKIRPKLRKVVRPNFVGLCSADSYPLRPNPTRLDRDFLFYLLLSRAFTDYAVGGSNRAGIPKVNREHLLPFEFALPSLNEQRRVALTLDETWHAAAQVCEELFGLATDESALRQAILREAFAGNL